MNMLEKLKEIINIKEIKKVTCFTFFVLFLPFIVIASAFNETAALYLVRQIDSLRELFYFQRLQNNISAYIMVGLFITIMSIVNLHFYFKLFGSVL